MALTHWTQTALKARENAVEEELVYGEPSDTRRALLEAEFHAIENEFERRAALQYPDWYGETRSALRERLLREEWTA